MAHKSIILVYVATLHINVMKFFFLYKLILIVNIQEKKISIRKNSFLGWNGKEKLSTIIFTESKKTERREKSGKLGIEGKTQNLR